MADLVKVRVAVAVSPDGSWIAHADSKIEDPMPAFILDHGDAVYFIEATVPVPPKPVVAAIPGEVTEGAIAARSNMSITENTIRSATEGVDDADRMPEITDEMIVAGVITYNEVDPRTRTMNDATTVSALVKTIFEAMWKARKIT